LPVGLGHLIAGTPNEEGSPGQAQVAAAIAGGSVMKKTQITAVFDFEKFKALYPNVLVMFMQDPKRLYPAPADLAKVPAGTSLFALVLPAA
jgi:hypothetical protein